MSIQGLNDVHVEKAHNILSALPRMSKDIVDDTIYEKVLSFLLSFLNSEDHGVQMYESWNVLGILTETCVSVDQDPRIKAICLRFLGKLIARDSVIHSRVFEALESSHQALLEQVVECSAAPEGALRVAAIEACHGFIHCRGGVIWILNNDTIITNLLRRLEDTNNYVSSAICGFYSTLIHNGYDVTLGTEELASPSLNLFGRISPTVHLSRMFVPSGQGVVLGNAEHPGRLTALEFCWTLASSHSPNILKYLQITHIFENIFKNVHDNNRLIRNRNVEILSAVLHWAPRPMTLISSLAPSDTTDEMEILAAYHALVSKGMELLDSDRFEGAITGMHLLRISLILAKRQPSQVAIPNVQERTKQMIELLQLCMRETPVQDSDTSGNKGVPQIHHHLLATQRSAHNRKTLMMLAFKSLHVVAHEFPEAIVKTNPLETFLDLLESQDFATDLRVLKPLLSQLSPLLATARKGHDQEVPTVAPDHGIKKTLSTLVRLLEDSQMDGRTVKLILQTFDSFLSNSELCEYMLQKDISHSVAQALALRLYDSEWDTRDSAVAFIGTLYEPPHIPARVEFAQQNNLALEVVNKIVDGEAYVRSAALDAIQSMMNNASGWIFIKQNELTKHIISKLPPLIHDPEALVRRAVLDSMACLVHNQAYENLFDEHGLSQTDMATLVDDTDWEVRLRACSLLHELWKTETQLRARSKKGYSDDMASFTPHFYALQGDQLLLFSTQDSARLVREKAMKVLQSIEADLKPDYVGAGSNRTKRLYALEEEDQGFADAIDKIDFDRLAATVSAEHMYEETFDIDYSGIDTTSMTESTHDNHTMDCE